METQSLEARYGGKASWSILFLVLAALLSAGFLLYRILIRLLATEGVTNVKFKAGAFVLEPGDRAITMARAITIDDLLYNFVIPFSLLCLFGLLLKWDWKKFFGFDRGMQKKDWIFLAVSILAIFFSGLLIDHESDPNSGFMLRMIRENGLIPLLLIPGFLLPVMEEITFRRFAYDLFSTGFLYPVLPIAITTIGFALLHNQYGGPALIYIFALGAVLGYARYFSGGILLPILIHAANNIIPILMLKPG